MFKSLAKVGLVSFLVTSHLNAISEYSKCVSCHGEKGERRALGKSKVIQDMSPDEIINALNGYKSGTYGGSMKELMKSQVMQLSKSDIEKILRTVLGQALFSLCRCNAFVIAANAVSLSLFQ